ncbi:MAG: hypothetical protein VX463_02765, partial [Pseudomonadota bacterium]|nr:hypothetical protein [Pseudomonadota bacterium]
MNRRVATCRGHARRRTRTAAVALAAAAACWGPGEAAAFWNLWRPAPPPPSEAGGAPPAKLDSLRESACGAGDAARSFADTAWGRGERPRAELAPELQAVIAAALASGEADPARRLLRPWLDDAAPAHRLAAAVTLAMALLRSGPGGTTEALELLAAPELAGDPDAAYLRAAAALDRRDWATAEVEAARVVDGAPRHYGAQTVLALVRLNAAGAVGAPPTPAQCARLLQRIAEAIEPPLRLGACPVHVAHLDLTADR